MCMYLLNGRMHMKTPNAMEYAHHTGRAFMESLMKEWSTILRDFVRKEPPLISAVKPSARSLKGKIDHKA